MKFNKTADILANVVFPLILGVLVYDAAAYTYIPDLIRNYTPDALWAYAFLSGVLIIWDRTFSVIWIVLVFVIAVGYEWLQHCRLLPGTGDVWDIAVYCLSFVTALKLNPFFKTFYKSRKTIYNE